jgi:hypothetical protein
VPDDRQDGRVVAALAAEKATRKGGRCYPGGMSVASHLSPSRRIFRAARALLPVGVFLAPLDASALSCEVEGVTAPFLRPVDVPTNTRIWCTTQGQLPSGSIVLRDAQGSVVSGTHSALSMRNLTVVVFRPDEKLAPESTYTYTCPLKDVFEFTFTTGAGPRLGAPPVPDASQWAAQAFYREGRDNYLVSFDNAAAEDSIVVFDVGGAASMDVDGPSGALSDVDDAVSHGVVYVGNSVCQNNWPEATLGASTTVALGTFDVTGAFSGWSETVTVTIPSTVDDRSPEGNPPGLDETPNTDSPPGGAPSGCGLSPPPDGFPMAASALAVVTGLTAARRCRHHRACRQKK